MASSKPKVEVRYMGMMEVRSGRRYRWALAWTVFVHGKELQPWMSEQRARKLAKQIEAEGVTR